MRTPVPPAERPPDASPSARRVGGWSARRFAAVWLAAAAVALGAYVAGELVLSAHGLRDVDVWSAHRSPQPLLWWGVTLARVAVGMPAFVVCLFGPGAWWRLRRAHRLVERADRSGRAA